MTCQPPVSVTLTTLPLELLLMIVGHLSSSDLACLALCSHALLDTFFAKRDRLKDLFPIWIHDDRMLLELNLPRITFLSQLSRDLPLCYLCYCCLKFHSRHQIRLPWELKNGSLTNTAVDKTNIPHPLQLVNFPGLPVYTLDFVHLHLAMKTFYLGPEFGIPPISLDWLGSLPHGILSIEARICPTPPSICFRIQRLQLVTTRNSAWALHPDNQMTICEHMSTGFRSVYALCMVSPPDPSSLSFFLSFRHCEKCNTSFKIDLQPLDRNALCLALTTWHDLGPGLNPRSTRWVTSPGGICQYPILRPESYDPVLDPRVRFEKDYFVPTRESASEPWVALSPEELYRRNLGILQGGRRGLKVKKMIRETCKLVGFGLLLIVCCPLHALVLVLKEVWEFFAD